VVSAIRGLLAGATIRDFIFKNSIILSKLKSSGGEFSISFPLHHMRPSKASVAVQCMSSAVQSYLKPSKVIGNAIFLSFIA